MRIIWLLSVFHNFQCCKIIQSKTMKGIDPYRMRSPCGALGQCQHFTETTPSSLFADCSLSVFPDSKVMGKEVSPCMGDWNWERGSLVDEKGDTLLSLLVLHPESGLEGVSVARSIFLEMGRKDGFCREEVWEELGKIPHFVWPAKEWVSLIL